MEQFRQLLRFAIGQKAKRVTIHSHGLSKYTVDGLSDLIAHEVGIFDSATIDNLVAFLFPNAATASIPVDGAVTGELQVPQVGNLPLIGFPYPSVKQISVYFPEGQSLYERDLATLNQSIDHFIPAPPTPPVPNADFPSSSLSSSSLLVTPENLVFSANQAPTKTSSSRRPDPESNSQTEAPGDLFQSAGANVLPAVDCAVHASQSHSPTHSQKLFEQPNQKQVVEEDFSLMLRSPEVKRGNVLQDQMVQAAQGNVFEVPADAAIPQPIAVASTPLSIPSIPAMKFPSEMNVDYLKSSEVSAPDQDLAVDPQLLGEKSSNRVSFDATEDVDASVSDGQNSIDSMLMKMVELKASDMHLTVNQPVILRIDGDIKRVNGDVITPRKMEGLLLPTLPKRNQVEFAKSNDTDYAYELRGVGRFRVNIFRDRSGVGAVLRHIPSKILSAQNLNLPPAIMNLCKLNKGLVLVTGPTGSGKSTTLAAMIDWINRNRREHILTIEDPIEFVHTQESCLINQREVHRHTTSFSRALKAALREDPDVILIGEMRDLETIAIALETAETGHLVFGTLHTTTAVSTVDRIIDQFPADRQAQIRTMLASSLKGVVAQTLLKKKGGGRVAAHEILILNDAVASMIREGKNHMIANHMLTQKQDGNILLNDALFKLIADGVIDPQDALFKAVDKNDFLLAAARRNIKLVS